MVSCNHCGKEINKVRECIVCEKMFCSTHYRHMMGVCTCCAPIENHTD